jgi:hypothetical protein
MEFIKNNQREFKDYIMGYIRRDNVLESGLDFFDRIRKSENY